MWEDFVQPLGWVDLDAINPHFPVQVRAGDAPGVTDFSDQLAGCDAVANGYVHFRLVIQTAVYSLAMVNDGGIATHGLEAGINDHAIGRSVDVERVLFGTDAIVNSGVEGLECPVIIGTAISIE